MPSIDLHCHSLYSDGTQSPQQLVSKRLDAGVKRVGLNRPRYRVRFGRGASSRASNNIKNTNGVEISAIWQ
jgi:histidinol phosphatase-like PHP family hydrolase